MRPVNSIVFDKLDSLVNHTSAPIWAWDIVRVTFQMVLTGSGPGKLTVQASNDMPIGLPPSQFVPTNWTTITATGTVTSPGNTMLPNTTGPFLPPLECSYHYLRLLYEEQSGGTGGTVTVTMHAKSL